jgi:predicted kinase
MQMAFLISGSTGAGKTTYSRKLAKERHALVFSIDEWMKTLFWMDAPQGGDLN